MSAAKQARAQRVFRAIADPTRRKILQMLAAQALSVGAICESFEASQPAISQHMRVLRESGLVEVEAQWRLRVYHLTPDGLREVMDWVRHFERFWNTALDRLDGVLDEVEPGGAVRGGAGRGGSGRDGAEFGRADRGGAGRGSAGHGRAKPGRTGPAGTERDGPDRGGADRDGGGK